jgi:hypothetical protein
MIKNLSSDNWKVRPLTTATAAGALGVGLCFLEFMNMDSGEVKPVGFFGAGIGVGLKGSGTLGGWTILNVDRKFSISELDYASGRITSLGMGVGFGVAFTYITAWKDYTTPALSLLTSKDRMGDMRKILDERASRFVTSRLPMPTRGQTISQRLKRTMPSVDLLFSSCPVGGFEAGTGAGGAVIVGVWKLL